MKRYDLSCSYALVLCGALLVFPTPTPAQTQPTGDPSILAPDSGLELLFSGNARTEGPAAGPDGSIYFVDVDLASGGTVWRLDPVSRAVKIFRNPSGIAAGLAFNSAGELLAAEYSLGGGRRITATSLLSGETSVVSDHFDGKPYGGLNDLVLDSSGRIYFTENDHIGPDEVLYHRGAGVYRVDPDGTVAQIIVDAGMPNGILISPDEATLYVGTNEFDVLGNGAILAYDLDSQGNVRFRSVLVDHFAEDGLSSDGMAIDTDGNLYVALFSDIPKTGIAVYRPDGTQVAFIPTPGPATNVTFGVGEEASTLFITAGSGLYRLPILREGYHPTWGKLH